VKSTPTVRSLANPRRTTLAHLRDTSELAPPVTPKPRTERLPVRTANPRRTVLSGERS
jgi:hypothetical protein